jgi:hypothetical protein
MFIETLSKKAVSSVGAPCCGVDWANRRLLWMAIWKRPPTPGRSYGARGQKGAALSAISVALLTELGRSPDLACSVDQPLQDTNTAGCWNDA